MLIYCCVFHKVKYVHVWVSEWVSRKCVCPEDSPQVSLYKAHKFDNTEESFRRRRNPVRNPYPTFARHPLSWKLSGLTNPVRNESRWTRMGWPSCCTYGPWYGIYQGKMSVRSEERVWPLLHLPISNLVSYHFGQEDVLINSWLIIRHSLFWICSWSIDDNLAPHHKRQCCLPYLLALPSEQQTIVLQSWLH